jgi:hypothetical protein
VRRGGSGRRVQHTKLHTATTGQTPHTIRKGYGVALGLRVGGAAHATQRVPSLGDASSSTPGGRGMLACRSP